MIYVDARSRDPECTHIYNKQHKRPAANQRNISHMCNETNERAGDGDRRSLKGKTIESYTF